jgi:hypothetical protein
VQPVDAWYVLVSWSLSVGTPSACRFEPSPISGLAGLKPYPCWFAARHFYIFRKPPSPGSEVASRDIASRQDLAHRAQLS